MNDDKTEKRQPPVSIISFQNDRKTKKGYADDECVFLKHLERRLGQYSDNLWKNIVAKELVE
jgi:hypothetical protein